jgi:hypothetical protein
VLAGNVHFVDIDIVDCRAGDGCVETGEELLKALIRAAAEHGDGLATLCSDCHGAHWFDVPDDDLTVVGVLLSELFGFWLTFGEGAAPSVNLVDDPDNFKSESSRSGLGLLPPEGWGDRD